MSLLSELPFTCLSLAALALIERARGPSRGVGLAVVAGLVASAAYLTRSIGLALLVAGPPVFLIGKQYRWAAAFALAMLPGAAAWLLWTHAHRLAQPDAVALYYTDYLGYWVHDGTARNLAVVLWRNLDNLLSSIGGMFVFGLGDSFAGKSLARVLAVAAIAGTARLWRRSGATAYVLFTAGCLLTLLLWHYPPDQRFIVPVFPVLLAGFSAELLRLAGKLRAAFLSRAMGERVAAGSISLALTALLCLAGARGLRRPVLGVAGVRGPAAGHGRRSSNGLPLDRREHADGRRRTRLPGSDAVPVHRAPCLPPGDLPGAEARRRPPCGGGHSSAGVADFAHRQKLSYAVLAPDDLHAEFTAQERLAAFRMFRADPRLRRVFEAGSVSVCRIE